MGIKIAAPAPSFEAEAYVRGEANPCRVALDAYRGSWVVLFFYPRDFTFVCPTELHAFGELEEEFAGEDAVLLAVSTDSYWSHKAWFETHPLLGDVATRSSLTRRTSSRRRTTCCSRTGPPCGPRCSSIRTGSSGTRASPTRASVAARTRRFASSRRSAPARSVRSAGARASRR